MRHVRGRVWTGAAKSTQEKEKQKIRVLEGICSKYQGLTEEAASMALTAAWKTFLGRRRLVVPLSTMLLS